ncbi:MAG: M56 family metallopeptidase [Verrucomicrobiota bacterium]
MDWLLQAGLRATLLLGGLFAVWRLLPAAQPALRRWVLLAASAGLLAAPWISGWWDLGTAKLEVAALNGRKIPSITEAGGSFSWAALLAWLWLAGSALVCIRLALESWALRRLIRKARPWSGPREPDGLTILQSSAISGPCVAGGRRPVLLLPGSAHAWTPAQWRMVLAHERQHLHQRDLLLAWLPRLVLCLYWWHPLTHWLRRQFHAESEALCDGAVVAGSGQGAREYVEFLMALNTGRLPAHSVGMAMKSRLGQRIERLLLTPPGPVRGWTAVIALSILLTLALTSISLRTLPASASGSPQSTSLKTAAAAAPAATDSPVSAADAPEIALRLSADAFPGD